jgi:hypothetical protein
MPLLEINTFVLLNPTQYDSGRGHLTNVNKIVNTTTSWQSATALPINSVLQELVGLSIDIGKHLNEFLKRCSAKDHIDSEKRLLLSAKNLNRHKDVCNGAEFKEAVVY